MSFRHINPETHNTYKAALAQLDRPAQLVEVKSVRDIISDLRKAESWLELAAVAAFIASAFFVVKYFVGGEMNPGMWSGEQWLNAVLGLGITAIITAAQAFLYASGYSGPSVAIATVILVAFGLFSEVSQSMERGDEIVKTRSENSAVYKAAVGSIGSITAQAGAPAANPYASQIASAERKLAQCRARLASGKERHCNGDQATVDSLERQSQQAMHTTTTATSSALSTAINQAKALEFDEGKQYAMMRLIKNALGVTAIFASFLFSLTIIGTFEYAFHFVGAYVADHKRALSLLGLDQRGNPLDDLPDGSDPTRQRRTRPAPTTSANSTSSIAGTSSAGATASAADIEQTVADLQRWIDDLRNTREISARLLAAQDALPANVTNLTAEREKRRASPAPATAKTAPNLTGHNLTVSPSEPYSKPPADSKPMAVSPATSKPSQHDNAIACLWQAIDKGIVKRISYPQVKALLKNEGITTDNDTAQQLAAVALDALEREGVAITNPKYDPSNPRGGFDKYIISSTYKRQPQRWGKAGEISA